jgi:hypothetical protein
VKAVLDRSGVATLIPVYEDAAAAMDALNESLPG